MNIKRFIPVALVAVAGLSIAACSSGGSSTSASSSNNTPSTQAPAQTPDQAYLADVCTNANKTGAPAVVCEAAQSDPTTTLQVGQSFCSDMGNGSTVSDEVLTADGVLLTTATNLSPTQVGQVVAVLIVTAAEDLCPQYIPEVKAYANSNS